MELLKKEELKKLVAGESSKVWNDSRMIDYCVKKSLSGLKFNAGLLVTEKPSIEKHFCFGYGLNGITSLEDEESAHREAWTAKNDMNYFIAENLKIYDTPLAALEKCLNSDYDKVAFIPQYNGRCELISYTIGNEWSFRNYHTPVKAIATDEEIKAIIEMLKHDRELFLKRLQSYLKKYGLSKVHSWTYLQD